MKKIEHLSEIFKDYNVFIIDLWGVIHNGISPIPEALEAIDQLYKNKKKFIFLSNAPRPSQVVRNFLEKMQINKKYLNNILTSGEAALKSIKEFRYGKKFFHLGPDRDKKLYHGLENHKTTINNCEYILCTGLYDDHMEDLNYYSKMLENFKNKIMVCTNPDLIVDRGEEREFCAGKIAQIFEDLGGKVVYFGKPHFEIYNLILKKEEKALMIGDNLQTDIKGANLMRQDSIFITEGVHLKEIESSKNIENVFKKYNAHPKFIQNKLQW